MSAVATAPAAEAVVVAPAGWFPRSPCDDACLPPYRPSSPAVIVRRLRRLPVALGLLLAGLGIAAAYPLLGGQLQARLLAGWSRAVLVAVGVRLRVSGAARFGSSGAAALVVTNHVSWLDIVVLNALQPCRMVAKHELRNWFVIGRLATAAGTLYVDRQRLSALPAMVADMTAALRAGACVAVFPEGATWCGRESGRYRRASFQAAVDAGAPVRPISLRFRHLDGLPTTAAAFVGEGTLFSSLLRVAGQPGLIIEAEVLPELPAADYPDRRALAAAAQAAVAAAIRLKPDAASAARIEGIDRSTLEP